MITVSRSELLHCLEAVDPARSPKETLAQSSCFVFRGGRVAAYDEDMLCRARSPLPKELTAVVDGGPLLEVLRRLTGETVDVDLEENRFKVKQRKRWAKINLQNEVLLPLSQAGKPETWKQLPPDFAEAVLLVGECCGKDDNKPLWTNIHVSGFFVEATDDEQLCRFPLKLPFDGGMLLKRKALKHVADVGCSKVAVLDEFVHFRNGSGVTVACRRFDDDYPDLALPLAISGSRIVLPKCLAADAEFAEIFSGEYADDNKVTVRFEKGSLTLTGVGVSGEAGTEPRKVNYKGPTLEFRVGPKLLSGIVARHTEAEVGPDVLKVNGGRWSYMTSLNNDAPQEKNGHVAENSGS